MKDGLVRTGVVILLLLSASGVNAHGLHIQELEQGAGGIMDEFIHLFVGHGYWVLLLLAGPGLVGFRTALFHRRLQQRRGGKRGHNHHQHNR